MQNLRIGLHWDHCLLNPKTRMQIWAFWLKSSLQSLLSGTCIIWGFSNHFWYFLEWECPKLHNCTTLRSLSYQIQKPECKSEHSSKVIIMVVYWVEFALCGVFIIIFGIFLPLILQLNHTEIIACQIKKTIMKSRLFWFIWSIIWVD